MYVLRLMRQFAFGNPISRVVATRSNSPTHEVIAVARQVAVRSIINSFGKLSFEHQAVALDQLKAHHEQSRSEKIAELKQHLAKLGHQARKVGRPQAITKVGSSPLKQANGLSKRRGKRSVVKRKYRDAKTGNTWSGRGRMASWLKAKQKAGEKIEKYLVA